MALTDDEKIEINSLINQYYGVSGGKVPYMQFGVSRRACKPVPPKPETMVHLDVGSSAPESKPSPKLSRLSFLVKPLIVVGCFLAGYFLVSVIVALVLSFISY